MNAWNTVDQSMKMQLILLPNNFVLFLDDIFEIFLSEVYIRNVLN